MELEIADPPRLLRRRGNWVIHHLIEYCERGGGCKAVVGIVVCLMQWWLQIFDYLHFLLPTHSKNILINLREY